MALNRQAIENKLRYEKMNERQQFFWGWKSARRMAGVKGLLLYPFNYWRLKRLTK